MASNLRVIQQPYGAETVYFLILLVLFMNNANKVKTTNKTTGPVT